MHRHTSARASATAVCCLLLASACSSKSGTRIDPNAPDEIAFQAALAHYDAATAAQTAARSPTEPAPAAKVALAESEFAAAQAGFQALQVDFPASIRVDNAAYLEGRSRYEIGTMTRLRGDFEGAWALLQAAIGAHPASKFMNSMTYFSGRAMFHMAELDRGQTGATTASVTGEYGRARAQFVQSVATNPGPPWGDNSAYYVGRCDFEAGYLGVHPLEAGATPSTDPAPFRLAEAELAAIPAASSYYDNARYFLGRSFFEEPAAGATDRAANLNDAVSAFTAVIAVPGPSPSATNAAYWRGRSRYALAFVLGTAASVDQQQLALALADMKTVSPTASVHAASALYFEAKCYVHFGAPGPYCTAARAGDPAPASACAAYRALATAFPADSHVATTASYLDAQACDHLACP